MEVTYTTSSKNSTYHRYPREATTKRVEGFLQQEYFTQAEFAQLYDIPRTTFQSQIYRVQQEQLKGEEARFYESSVGLECLHRIVRAAIFVIAFRANRGVRLVQEFLQLSQLNQYVASSVGILHSSVQEMEEVICEFGEEERKRLARKMAPKILILCLDETFHPTICLVAIDPLSGYVLLEKYVQKRDTQTWSEAIQKALDGLSIELIECVSDEAKALVSLVEKELGIHHSPDLFHVLHEVVKATSLALNNQRRAAEKAYVEAQKDVEDWKQKRESFQDKKNRTRPDFTLALGDAEKREKERKEEWEKASSRKADVKEALEKLSNAYHLFDLETGQGRNPKQAEKESQEALKKIKEIATEANLSESSQERLEKARKMIPKLSKTLLMIWHWIFLQFEFLGLSHELEKQVFCELLAGYYLLEVAQKERLAERKKQLQQQAEILLKRWNSRDGPVRELREGQPEELEDIARESVRLFVRTSSIVEGRNAHLRQSHRGSHKLSERRLQSLTTVHNFFIKRPDNTTAAERFFEAKPRELFGYILGHTKRLPRPRKTN